MKKNEIIEALLSKGCKMEDISGLKIKELRAMLDEENAGEDSLILLGQVKESEEDVGIVKTPAKTTEVKLDKENNNAALVLSNPPVPSDAGWTQYIMGLFMDDELENQNPRMEGLRRIAELLIGEVIEERSELISAPTQENEYRACTKCTLVFENGRIFEALADACSSNCQKEFSQYPVAVSDTRSKARAYRSALRLKRIVSAEEIGIVNAEEEDKNRNIQTGQLTAIRLLAERSSISIKKLLDDLEISCDLKDNIVDLKSLKYSEALIILSRLNDLRQSGHVPEKLKK
jgi:hypothetical protein